MFEAYRFPNGYTKQASNIFGWLRHDGFSPSWLFENGEEIIKLPVEQKESLQNAQKVDPARYGNWQDYKEQQ